MIEIWAIHTVVSLVLLSGGLGLAQSLWCSGGASKSASGADKTAHPKRGAFKAFQLQYLAVYLLIMLADWLQGTHMYTLYTSYGFSGGDVGTLFVIGFTSSLVFGTFLGLYVDKYGRKLGCIVFCVLEIIINTMEHSHDFRVLCIGRVLGGMSTSLLFCSFETWMVSAHRKGSYPEKWLAETCSIASVGNGVVAIAAGFIAQISADALGDIGPFRVAIALTVVVLLLVLTWEENTGVEEEETEVVEKKKKKKKKKAQATGTLGALRVVVSSPAIVLLGFVQSLFEGAMYTFVFQWVPTLMGLLAKEGSKVPTTYFGSGGPGASLPTGVVFSCFMACTAMGGIASYGFPMLGVERSAVLICVLAACSMVVPALGLDFAPTFIAFLTMEFCVGAFYPAMGIMRAKYVPNSLQSTIMTIFRLPLNVLVIVGTKLDTAPFNLSTQGVFAVVALWFAAGAFLQAIMFRIVNNKVVAKEA